MPIHYGIYNIQSRRRVKEGNEPDHFIHQSVSAVISLLKIFLVNLYQSERIYWEERNEQSTTDSHKRTHFKINVLTVCSVPQYYLIGNR